jgi:hypothetical protein
MYLGARKLTVDRREKGKDAIEEYEHFHFETSGTLQARTPVGYGYSLTLTGENLHGNSNRSYWPKAMKRAYEEGEDFDREELACQRALPDGIGFLSMHLDLHYKASSKTEFSSQSCLPLGNYGPFQKEGMCRQSMSNVWLFELSLILQLLYHPQIVKQKANSRSSLSSLAMRRTSGLLMSKKNSLANDRSLISLMMRRDPRMKSLERILRCT